MTIGLYKITNTVNGKYYIGSSTNIKRRWINHKNNLRRGIHYNPHLQASFNKYGVDCFHFEIIQEFPDGTDRSVILDAEQKMLDLIKPEDWKHSVYNASTNVDGCNPTEDIRRKMSQSHQRNWANPDFREYMKQFSQKGKVLSEEHKKKISQSNMGKKMSPEAIRKNSEAKKGRKLPEDQVNNLKKALHKNMSGKGVYLLPSGKYFARIHHNGKTIYLGQYETYEEALEARLAGEKKYWLIEDGSDVTIACGT